MPTLQITYQNSSPQRVDKFLAGSLPQLTRTEIKDQILAGQLKIDDRVIVKPAAKVSAGQKVDFAFEITDLLAPKSEWVNIRYEDEDMLIVEKPAGLPVYATSKKHPKGLLNIILARFPQIRQVGEKDRPGIVHRLDKQTSGLLIVAKSAKGFTYLKKVFASRTIAKEYLTLVYGRTPKQGIIEQPLTKIGQGGRSKVRVSATGKPAVTEYRALANYYFREKKEDGGLDQFTLLAVKLHTGRTHQLRVHFASIGHPVMGDDLYGRAKAQKLGNIVPRLFLHAAKLGFKKPNGEWLEITSELPDDLKKVLSSLSIVT